MDIFPTWVQEICQAVAIHEAAARANIPVDVIVEVGEVRPEMFR